MKTTIQALLVALAVAASSSLLASRAEAQGVARRGPWATPPAVVAPAYYSSYYVPPYTYPYSYYAALPFPARGYVGLGSNDFPYYGRPYGSPSDPWTWPYMSSGGWALARYYYPPVR